MTTSGFGLAIGPLQMMGAEYDDFALNVLGANATYGNPEPISQVIASMMRDGDLTKTARFGNREAVFDVRVYADNFDGLGVAEAMIEEQLDKPNDLRRDVPYGPPTIFSVVRAWSEFMYDDVEENLVIRTFRLHFECRPHGRSQDLVSINWTGGATELDPLTSLTGWTVVSGPAPTMNGGFQTSGVTRLRKTVTLDEYLWFKISRASGGSPRIHTVTVDGAAIPDALIRLENLDPYFFFTVPVRAWRRQTVDVEFTLDKMTGPSTKLLEFWTVSYPNKTTAQSATVPRGIGVIDVLGSARAPFIVEFTVPTGGAFLYTAPDPNFDLRERGLPEILFKYEVTADPPDNYRLSSETTDPQPRHLNPNGIWPAGVTQGVVGTSSVYAYPASDRAAVTFFKNAGARQVVSADDFLPQGFHGDSIAHEEHVLHARRCGFALLDAAANPIPCTITYYPHHRHNASL